MSSDPSSSDPSRALHRGLPSWDYSSDEPDAVLAASVGTCLREEIENEALTRDVPAIDRPREFSVLGNCEQINCSKVAAGARIARSTVPECSQRRRDKSIG